jgi:hypothetical protein
VSDEASGNKKENQMRKRLYILILVLATGVSFTAGAVLQELPSPLRSQAQEQLDNVRDNKIPVRGGGFASTSKRPPGEKFIFYTSADSFRMVPPGKTFIMTDMFYNTRGVKQNLTVNLAEAMTSSQNPDAPFKADNFLQMDFKPDESKETHLCTGYAIRSGHGVTAWTNAGLDPQQAVQIVVTGYLIDEVR